MVTVQRRIRLDAINAGARQVQFGRALLTAIAVSLWAVGYVAHKGIGGTLYGIGWFGGKVVWPALVWMALAVKVGWVDARGGARGPA
jgi:hypothetical protein